MCTEQVVVKQGLPWLPVLHCLFNYFGNIFGKVAYVKLAISLNICQIFHGVVENVVLYKSIQKKIIAEYALAFILNLHSGFDRDLKRSTEI